MRKLTKQGVYVWGWSTHRAHDVASEHPLHVVCLTSIQGTLRCDAIDERWGAASVGGHGSLGRRVRAGGGKLWFLQFLGQVRGGWKAADVLAMAHPRCGIRDRPCWSRPGGRGIPRCTRVASSAETMGHRKPRGGVPDAPCRSTGPQRQTSTKGSREENSPVWVFRNDGAGGLGGRSVP